MPTRYSGHLLSLSEIEESNMQNVKIATGLFAFALLTVSSSSYAFKLIKDEEAKLPAAAGGMTTRGITRGPGIKVVSPDLSAGPEARL
jgi:hypothetical protein